MTNRDDTPPLIYIPTLHRELAGGSLPGHVLFLDPGLPQTEQTPGCYRPHAFPFSRKKASQVLHELLAIGETLDVASPSGSAAARQHQSTIGMPSSEEADIVRFSLGKTDHTSDSSTKDDNAAMAAQKVLLLSWDLEERLLEINRLRQDIINAAKPLDESIHGPGAEEENSLFGISAGVPTSVFAALSSLPEAKTPDWRLAVAAIAVFLPKNAVLVTAHPGLRDALQEKNLLAPLPETIAERLVRWPASTPGALLWTKSPLWRVLGYTDKPENSPWLLAEPDILICPE